MSNFVLTSATVWMDGLALTNYANEVSVKTSIDDQEVTTFASGGYRERIAGLKTVDSSVKGLWQSPVDAPAWTNLAVADQNVTYTSNGTVGEPAHFFQGSNFSVERFGKIGEVDPFGLSIMSTNAVGMVNGQLAAAKGNISATGVLGSGQTGLSTNSQVSATQYLYGVVHVFTAGTTMTLKIQSDDNAGFSSPTDRITLSAITTTGGTWVTRLAGPITDTYFRYNCTAITGTFNVAAAIGIA